MTGNSQICHVGGTDEGTFLPLFGDDENRWHAGIRIPLYLVGLGWCFLGVALISDIFMSAIECITSKKTRRYDPNTKRFTTVTVWNATVANLTLMALGSSAPEILLSVIELISKSFFTGPLGPSTIVGSAAFNLFCIIAVCVSAIPDGEIRRIKEMPVYWVTAAFSLFAYLWLLIILMVGDSKNVVEPWEGIVTFLMFPGLVGLAFLADKGYLTGKEPQGMEHGIVLSAEMTKEELAEMDTKIRKTYGQDLTPEQVSKIAQIENGEGKSRAMYRVAATRAMTGAKRVKNVASVKDLARSISGPLGARLAHKLSWKSNHDVKQVVPEVEEGKGPKLQQTLIEFAACKYAVLENAGTVRVKVKRSGGKESAINARVTVDYKTRDGTANAESDYVATEGTLIFGPGETEKIIEVKIIDDIAFEADEEFFVDLSNPVSNDLAAGTLALGTNASATVVIIDDDLPGVICFPEDDVRVPEKVHDYEFDVTVIRKHGCTGTVTCKYKSENASALAGQDFDEVSGTLTLLENQTTARIPVKIRARGRYERKEEFRIVLSDITGGAKFDAETDGGADTCIQTIIIESEQAGKDRVDRLMSVLAVNWDKAKVGHANWWEQFRCAVLVNGGEDEGEPGDGEAAGGGPSIQDWIMHIITLPWKVLFALVPPTDYCGGWLCFWSSLGMIAIVTAIIGDVASLLGCVMDIPPEVTAITFVALGTSLPDTFASKAAAVQDRYADAAIGNVTGSNSVNVFLGLGLPWMIGSIYWRSGTPNAEWNRRYLGHPDIAEKFQDGAFIVMAGNLSASVVTFTSCALVCIAVLYIRRLFFKGELGGPRIPKMVTSCILVFLWFVYIGVSTFICVNNKNSS